MMTTLEDIEKRLLILEKYVSEVFPDLREHIERERNQEESRLNPPQLEVLPYTIEPVENIGPKWLTANSPEGHVRIYSQPTPKSSRVGKLKNGQSLKIKGRTQGYPTDHKDYGYVGGRYWYQVDSGFVIAAGVSFSGDIEKKQEYESQIKEYEREVKDSKK